MAWNGSAQTEHLLDGFDSARILCAFMRKPVQADDTLRLRIEGNYCIQSSSVGGWLLLPNSSSTYNYYWIPRLPCLRRIDADGHILAERPLNIETVNAAVDHLEVLFSVSGKGLLDIVVWCFPMEGHPFTEVFGELSVLETQPYFIYGSHSTYNRPADVYAHLIHGYVYDTQFIWPRYWKIADELDAYALYLVLSGLEFSTGKHLYGLLKRQILYSVIARQREDGGWYHGEWTDRMECHVRLHCGGMHLLATALEEQHDPVIAEAFRKSAAFVAKLTDETAMGAWFLHDTLELSRDGMNHGPFPWLASRVLGKSETNMLVLNTHLDTLIALDRYRRLTGDTQFDVLITSGQRATAAILARRPAEALYRFLYRLIDLTLLPVESARRLPLPLRALKRLTWKYLTPRMHRIRTRWPRLVMPNGFIDRALSLRGVSHAYQTVNLWDLIRYQRRFPDQPIAEIINKALTYIQNTPLRSFWVEHKKKGHALGFWADVLWHLCMVDPEPDYRRWLGEAMIACEDAGWGMPPALLGANTEAVPVGERLACPIPTDHRLRIANLSRSARVEVVIVNPGKENIPLRWQDDRRLELQWQSSAAGDVHPDSPVAPARGWLWGCGLNP